MTHQEIEQKVRSILSKKLAVDLSKIGASTRLAEDMGVDSFGALELMFEIEEAFDLKVSDTEIETMRSVNDIIVYLQHCLDKQATH